MYVYNRIYSEVNIKPYFREEKNLSLMYVTARAERYPNSANYFENGPFLENRRIHVTY